MEVGQVVPIIVGIVAAAASVASALVARRSAAASRETQREIERLKIVEARVAATKTEIYRPMLEGLNDVFQKSDDATSAGAPKGGRPPKPKATLAQLTHQFAPWLTIIGSDDAVTAFRNLMQGVFNDAPPQMLLRLYADFFVAARRDMGDPDTRITAEHVLGIRITDMYKGRDMLQISTLSLPDLGTQYGWSLPWLANPADLPAVVPTDRDPDSDVEGQTHKVS